MKFYVNWIENRLNENKNENTNTADEDTYLGALRAPLAGSLACGFAFVFVAIYVQFDLGKKVYLIEFLPCPIVIEFNRPVQNRRRHILKKLRKNKLFRYHLKLSFRYLGSFWPAFTSHVGCIPSIQTDLGIFCISTSFFYRGPVCLQMTQWW